MTAQLHPRNVRVAERLQQAGIPGRIVVLPVAAATAAQAAAALGVEVGAIANSLVFWCDERPLLVMTSGAHRVDTAALAQRLGRGRIARATAEQVLEATGQVIGGVAPTGHPAAIETIVDPALGAYPQVWAAAGTAHTVFPLSFEELVRLTDGRVERVD
ncbi:YbaK/EbsC family protein [Microbacterium sp. NPDC096154]|uniref:YbaK/EbsC family protein n=1 Tax=Microbacterium sp. NPDC096154 TaxID=3155549 RepID=UPI0033234062